MRISVIKPDHLGDLILSVPAIRALATSYEVSLFVNPQTRFLAQYLFPEIEIGVIQLHHLSKTPGLLGQSTQSPEKKPSDLALFLRRDSYLERFATRLYGSNFLMVQPVANRHETLIQKDLVEKLTGNYSRTKYFNGPDHQIKFEQAQNIGLCISSGFSGNTWSLANWLKLGRQLLDAGKSILIIGGPKEAMAAKLLCRDLRRWGPAEVLIGTIDVGNFLNDLSDIDYIIATDSGTAHICSLRVPIVSLFGPSPAERYAPFGRFNWTISSTFYCSPCLQFDRKRINHCLSRECMSHLTPDIVFDCLTTKMPKPGSTIVRITQGLSHTISMESSSPRIHLPTVTQITVKEYSKH